MIAARRAQILAGAELLVKNESDQPIHVVADPHETLTLKTSERLRD